MGESRSPGAQAPCLSQGIALQGFPRNMKLWVPSGGLWGLAVYKGGFVGWLTSLLLDVTFLPITSTKEFFCCFFFFLQQEGHLQ